MSRYPVLMPRFDRDGSPGTVREWLVADGQVVAAGAGVVVVEGPKAVLELETWSAGRVERCLAAGESAAPQTVLAWITPGPEEVQ
ncbi:MAG: hypothetical protein IT204_10215 [Fimbriimonadaceae bacterium]|nr:hypothetical protein [Fimbriimonadaceae bacterium]